MKPYGKAVYDRLHQDTYRQRPPAGSGLRTWCEISTSWDRSNKGYAGIFVGGKHTGSKDRFAHRVSLEFKLGRKLKPHVHAMHKCDVKRCINPDHLEPGTAKENNDHMAQRLRHGRAKLVPQEVLEVVDRHSLGESMCSIARDFGMAHATIRAIVTGRTWSHVTGIGG